MADGDTLDLREVWRAAIPYADFIAGATSLQKLWEGVFRTGRIPDWAVDRARAAGTHYLVCITEDWCWDAANTVPVVAKLCATVAQWELRVVKRDEHPEVMDAYLTEGTRSIPIVIVLDTAFRELGHWGPRPLALQRWAKEHRAGMDKSEFYGALRKLYVKDRGESVLREVLEVIG
ncbi:MAG: thioredoxin family protein [Gemmatimonadales bacterium]|jgi:hypothetical protein